MSSKSKAPSIPMGEVMSWAEWLKGRRGLPFTPTEKL
jgi:hypothetical protein